MALIDLPVLRCGALGAAVGNEFANANPAHGAVGGATHDEALLEGFVDHADEAVYAAARELFEAHERRVRGGLATNLLSRAFDGNVGLKKPRRVIK